MCGFHEFTAGWKANALGYTSIPAPDTPAAWGGCRTEFVALQLLAEAAVLVVVETIDDRMERAKL